jgi:hypothetical protein
MITRPVLIQGLVLIGGMTLVAGVVPAWLEGKSRTGIASRELGEKLASFPVQLGEWECISDERLKPQVERTLRCDGYINRVYWNSRTGGRVSLAILHGPRGPMAVHTPEICYSSRGRVPAGEPQEVVGQAEASGNTFWKLAFKQPKDVKADLEVWYAWSDGGEWIACSYPRYWMTNNLFKLQLSGPPGNEGQESNGEMLLKQAVPAFQKILQP